jgi:hypothetical protein
MNPQLIIPVSMFIISEVLPFLPCKQNSVLLIAVRGLNVAKIIPNDTYNNFLKATQNGTNINTDKVATISETVHKMEHNVKISFVFEKPKED